jgi:hypothetical protein
MHGYLMRMCVATAAGVTLSTVRVAGASASGAASPARQAARASQAGTSLAVNPASGTVYVTGQSVAPSGLYDYATVAGAQQWVQRPAACFTPAR